MAPPKKKFSFEVPPGWTQAQAEEHEARLRLLPLLAFPGARPNQFPPNEREVDPIQDWATWLILAGRGFGKTRTGAEWLVQQVATRPGLQTGLCAQTWAVAKGVCIEGPSGVQTILRRRKIKFSYNKTEGLIVLENGSQIRAFSAENPEKPRGFEYNAFWMDEWAAWNNLEAATSNIRMGNRIRHIDGIPARTVITTTPKPLLIIRKMVASPFTVVTKGATRDNRSNLDPMFYAQVMADYGGSNLGRQELEGELLDDTSGLLFSEKNVHYWDQIQSRDRGLRFYSDHHNLIIDSSLCEWFVVVDVAAGRSKTQSDWTVASVFAYDKESGLLFLVDVRRAKLTEEQHSELVAPLPSIYPRIRKVYVEKSMYSTTLIRDLAQTLSAKNVSVVPIDPGRDSKIVRNLPAAAMAQADRILYPKNHPLCQISTSMADRGSVIDELLEFPYGEHDDFVDTLGYAAKALGQQARLETKFTRPETSNPMIHPQDKARSVFDDMDTYERKLRRNRRNRRW